MKAGFYDVELRVSNFRGSFSFYDALFRWLGWKQIDRGRDYCGWDYPEYHRGYYAVYFEDPDRIKFEIAHVPLRPRARRAAGVI